MKERILFVDDDPNVLEAYQRKLQSVLHVFTALGPHAALRDIQEKGPFAVVITDMNMPLMNGIEFLEKVKQIAPDTVRMMLTGNADIKVAIKAVNEGAIFRFLTKPCPSNIMGEALIAGINQYRLIRSEKELLDGTLKGTVELLMEIFSWSYPELFGLTLQLRNQAMKIAEKLDVKELWEIEVAATLSQIGLMAIPKEVLTRVTEKLPLQEGDLLALESVPAIGEELLRRIPRFENVARIVLYQNKQYNGGGFPDDRIAGKDIPLGARILKVINDFRQLRDSGVSKEDCLIEMNRREGFYDPAILNLVLPKEAPQSAAPQKENILQFYVKDLRAGLVLAEPIVTLDGKKLVHSGTAISDALLTRIKGYALIDGVKEPIDVYAPNA